jgi:hypothetical protein
MPILISHISLDAVEQKEKKKSKGDRLGTACPPGELRVSESDQETVADTGEVEDSLRDDKSDIEEEVGGGKEREN